MIVLSVSKYNFVDKQTGEVNRGASLWFIDPKSANEYGCLVPVKSSISEDLADKLLTQKFPFKADISFSIRSGSQARGQILITDIKFLEPFKM